MLGFLYLVRSGQKAVSQYVWESNWHRDCSLIAGSASGWLLFISPTYSSQWFLCQTQEWAQPLCISCDLRQTLGVPASCLGCAAHITWCLPHGEGEPQLFPFSCTAWQQWGAQITLLGSQMEDAGQDTGTDPNFSRFSPVPVMMWKNYEGKLDGVA